MVPLTALNTLMLPATAVFPRLKMPWFVKTGSNWLLLVMPVPFRRKAVVGSMLNSNIGAPVLKTICPMLVLFEIVTDVGAPLLVNVATPVGAVVGNQLPSVVHSAPGPDHVAFCAAAGPASASAASNTTTESAPSARCCGVEPQRNKL